LHRVELFEAGYDSPRWVHEVQGQLQEIKVSERVIVFSEYEGETDTASLVGLDAETGTEMWRRVLVEDPAWRTHGHFTATPTGEVALTMSPSEVVPPSRRSRSWSESSS